MDTHTGLILSIAFSPDGKTLASGSVDATIMLWDVEKGQSIGDQPLLGSAPVTCVAFSPDGKTLASGSVDTTIFLWDVEKRQSIGQPWSGIRLRSPASPLARMAKRWPPPVKTERSVFGMWRQAKPSASL